MGPDTTTKLLEFLTVNCRPPYVSLILRRHVFSLNLLILRLLPIILGPAIVYELYSWIFDHSRTQQEVISIYFSSIVSCTGIFFLAHAYSRTRDACAQFIWLLTDEEQRERLQRDFKLMFGARIQSIFALGFLIFGYFIVSYMGLNIAPPVLIIVLIVAGILFLVSGYGLGLAIMTIVWIGRFPKYGDLELFLVPSRTDALRTISQLTGTFALYFSTQLVLELILVTAIEWESSMHVQNVLHLILLPLGLFSLFFLAYPQLVLINIIKRHRRNVLLSLEEQVATLWRSSKSNDLSQEHFERIGKLVGLHEQVTNTSISPLDLNTASRFVTSVALPVIALSKDSILLGKVIEYAKRLLQII